MGICIQRSRDTHHRVKRPGIATPLLLGTMALPFSASAASPDPANATYLIDDSPRTLSAGRAVWAAAPGSAATATLELLPGGLQADVNADGRPDAVSWLRSTGGGSGTFYWLALIIDGEPAGPIPLAFMGDRIVPGALAWTGMAVRATWLGRPDESPMAAPAETPMATWLYPRAEKLVDARAEGGQILVGRVVFGHEVREFTPCFEPEPAWLHTPDRARAALVALKEAAGDAGRPYLETDVRLLGIRMMTPPAGFAGAYSEAVELLALLETGPDLCTPTAADESPADQASAAASE